MNKKLLNEIGDTPAGQKALRYARIRAENQAWLAKTGETIEKTLPGGTPEKAAEYAEEHSKKQRIVNMIKQRMGEPVNEGMLGDLAKRAGTAVVAAANQAGKKAKQAGEKIVKGIENMPSNKALLGGLLSAGAEIAQGVERERQMGGNYGSRKQRKNALQTFGSASNTVAKKIAADQRRRNIFGNP